MYPTIPSAQTILLYCLRFNITDVVISPGSRNVPLAIGFASNKKMAVEAPRGGGIQNPIPADVPSGPRLRGGHLAMAG